MSKSSRIWKCKDCKIEFEAEPPDKIKCPNCHGNNTVPNWALEPITKPEYEERKAIVTKFGPTKFIAVLPNIETSTKVEGSVASLSASVDRGEKKVVEAFVVEDERIPTNGPIPKEAWDAYWVDYVKNVPSYMRYISGVVTQASGSIIKPENIELKNTITVKLITATFVKNNHSQEKGQ